MIALATLWLPAEAAAQAAAPAGPPVAEFWGAWAVVTPIGNGTLDVAYEPPMRLGGTPLESRAHQVLNVQADAGPGIGLGVNVFLNRVVGLQAGFAATWSTVGGTNGDYDTFLRYISRPPPDYQPVENTYAQSAPWGPTAGTLGYRAFAVGGVARWRTPTGRVGGTLAGGVNIDWYAGELESVGYTQFILGGHSTLFPVTHRVRVGPSGSGHGFAPYVGGDVHVAMTPRVAIMAGVRINLKSGRAVPIQVTDLVDPGENPWVPEVSEVAAALDGLTLELPGTRWHALVGLKLFVR
jgi:hypothetical protein